ncbi:GTP 3',8-cyclase MoaA [Micrococcoides hystricis]|uniref:GTP 3',8-cyclase n=1 Tax=Micrococcoides hystricis TaxID=1572761 RepID=A0ABV6PAU5_9MICC
MPSFRPRLDVDGVDLTAGLVDRFGRVATDLRLSLIDKCNLRCTYCMPAEGMDWLPKNELLTKEEILRLVRIGVDQLGIEELRLTGGEPLVRADLVEIIAALRAAHPELPISLTTNGIGLDAKAAQLAAAGLSRINISLDTLHEETFAQLTRRDHLPRVLEGIKAAYAAGLQPVKINSVLMRHINDDHVVDLVSWALEHNYQLRFIEQMPLDADRGWTKEGTVTAEEIRQQIRGSYTLVPEPAPRAGAPAERYLVFPATVTEEEALCCPEKALGVVGIIASVTEPFCGDCKRTRITAEGHVMSCLFSTTEVDLRSLLRSEADDETIAKTWAAAMYAKPRAHGMDRTGLGEKDFVQPDRSMSAIGG